MINSKPQSNILPVLSILHRVAFPGVNFSLSVKSNFINAINDADSLFDKQIIIVAQHEDEDIKSSRYNVGVLCSISVAAANNRFNNASINTKCIKRVHITGWVDEGNGYLKAAFEEFKDECSEEQDKIEAYVRALIQLMKEYLAQENSYKLNPAEILNSIEAADHRSAVYLLAHHIDRKIISVSEKQEILEEPDLVKQIKIIMEAVQAELSILERQQKIRQDIKNVVNASRNDLLRKQLEAIQAQLNDEDVDEVTKYQQIFSNLKLSESAKKEVDAELKKLRSLLHQSSAELPVVRNYLELMSTLPWGKTAKVKITQSEAEKILDRYHYGLSEIKQRILQLIALQSRIGSIPNVVLCLFGPPGIGKTTLASSIAEAMGRKFRSVACGGVTDEADFRGHRRTYVGSMPGRIISAVQSAGCDDLVILLDEIGSSEQSYYRSNPIHVLRELLDPSQNHNFVDHYVGAGYDLSKAVFILTTNDLSKLPEAIRDRTYVIEMYGYSAGEKIRICKDYLIPKMYEAFSLVEQEDIQITDNCIEKILLDYSQDSPGVRNLKRIIDDIGMWVVQKLERRKDGMSINSDLKLSCITIDAENLHEVLGPPTNRESFFSRKNQIGVANGLAWSTLGGTILPIQAVLYKGSGKVITTGNIGKVMEESVKMILSLLKRNAFLYAIDTELFEKSDVHVHFPDAATKKDGPSAGVTVFSALLSIFSGFEISCDVAMTGEVALHGEVLPIGGLKEKLIAALRAGVKKVLVPAGNKLDYQKFLPSIIQSDQDTIEIIECKEVTDIIQHIFSIEDVDLMQKGQNRGFYDHVKKNVE